MAGLEMHLCGGDPAFGCEMLGLISRAKRVRFPPPLLGERKELTRHDARPSPAKVAMTFLEMLAIWIDANGPPMALIIAGDITGRIYARVCRDGYEVSRVNLTQRG